MLLSKGSVKLRSLGLSTFVLTLAMGTVGVAGTGCIFVDDHHGHGDESMPDPGDPDPPQDQISQVAIEADQALSANPGEGVGIFVEYRSGGEWHIWTTCDTNFSGVTCPFDIYTSVDSSSTIFSITEENLEGFDSTTTQSGLGTVDLHFETGGDYDAAEIDVTPGAILRVEAVIDGQTEPRFIYWFGDGVLHEGAPTTPIDFIPTKP